MIWVQSMDLRCCTTSFISSDPMPCAVIVIASCDCHCVHMHTGWQNVMLHGDMFSTMSKSSLSIPLSGTGKSA